MGQGEILQFLKENEGQIFTSKEVCMALNLGSASSSLGRLRRYPPDGFNFSKEGRGYLYWYEKINGGSSIKVAAFNF